MNKTMSSIIILIVLSLISSAVAQQPLMVHDAWIRPAPPSAKMLAAYMVIKNNSPEAKELTAVSSPMFAKVEIHRTEMHEGMMRMIPQEKLTVPAGGAVTLKPGGYHLMLIGPKAALKEGDKVDMELHFDNGQTLHLKVPARAGADKGGIMEGH